MCCVKIKVMCEAYAKFLHEVILPCFVLNYAKCRWIENGKQKHVGKVEEVKDGIGSGGGENYDYQKQRRCKNELGL